MQVSLINLWIGYANIFIATFIMIYAYLFLKKTNEHKDRRPWDFLFVASFFFFIFQIFNLLVLSGIPSIMGTTIDTGSVSNVLSFLYSGCVLLAFVSQHDLILRNYLILISKKDNLIAQEDAKEKKALGKMATPIPTPHDEPEQGAASTAAARPEKRKTK